MKTLRLLALLTTAFLVAASGAESSDSKPIPRVLVTPDPIDQLVADLAAMDGEWVNGLYQPVKLPESATTEEVLQQVFQMMHVSDYKVLEVRQVKIPPDGAHAYNAALYQTSAGKKIELFQFQTGGWWNRSYDTAPGPPGAHAAFPGRGEWSEEVQGLSCRITTEKTEYPYGEVVRMLVEIRNKGDKPLTLEPEPRVGISGNDKNSFPQQPAVLDMTFSQGKPGYASNHEITFTRGQQSEARALVVECGKTFSEFVEVTPWGLTLSSIPATPQPGKMSLQTVLQQKLTPDDKVTSLPFKPVEFTVLAKRETDKASPPENAEVDALRDLQAGTPKCHVVGEPAPHFANWKTILKRDYGIELVPCGCKGESDYVKRYQVTVLPELKKRHGDDFLKISEEKARKEVEAERVSKPDLWASISVNEPVFSEGGTDRLQIFFALVNDGKTTVNPKTNTSHLWINGEEVKDWSFIEGNGPRSSDRTALPPSASLKFTYAMGDHFKKPGTYKVRWEGENFKASEITFRVLPKPQP